MDSCSGNKPVCVIIGVGPGLGTANAQKFSNAGYALGLISRSSGYITELAGQLNYAKAYACDVTNTENIKQVFAKIKNDLGPVNVLIYQASSRFNAQGSAGNIEVATEEDMEHAWRIDTLGCMVSCKQVIPDMVDAGKGSIIICGATGSLRGSANFTAFGCAKNGQRALAESMAKHLGPKGVHVSLVIIDGSIDAQRAGNETLIKAEEVSNTLYFVAHQDKSAWTFQLDLRPFLEKF